MSGLLVAPDGTSHRELPAREHGPSRVLHTPGTLRPSHFGGNSRPHPPPAPDTAPTQGYGNNSQTASQTHNPWPNAHLKVAQGFLIRRAINVSANVRICVPETDDGHIFCLGYHLKGGCNYNCGGMHSHCTMTQGKMVRIVNAPS